MRHMVLDSSDVHLIRCDKSIVACVTIVELESAGAPVWSEPGWAPRNALDDLLGRKSASLLRS